MKKLKIVIILIGILISCSAFSQSDKLNTCDSIRNNQSLQIFNFKTVVTKNKALIDEIQLDNQALEKNLEEVQLHLQKTKKTTKILIPITLFVGIFSGYLVGYFTTKN